MRPLPSDRCRFRPHVDKDDRRHPAYSAGYARSTKWEAAWRSYGAVRCSRYATQDGPLPSLTLRSHQVVIFYRALDLMPMSRVWALASCAMATTLPACAIVFPHERRGPHLLAFGSDLNSRSLTGSLPGELIDLVALQLLYDCSPFASTLSV